MLFSVSADSHIVKLGFDLLALDSLWCTYPTYYRSNHRLDVQPLQTRSTELKAEHIYIKYGISKKKKNTKKWCQWIPSYVAIMNKPESRGHKYQPSDQDCESLGTGPQALHWTHSHMLYKLVGHQNDMGDLHLENLTMYATIAKLKPSNVPRFRTFGHMRMGWNERQLQSHKFICSYYINMIYSCICSYTCMDNNTPLEIPEIWGKIKVNRPKLFVHSHVLMLYTCYWVNFHAANKFPYCFKCHFRCFTTSIFA